MNFNTQKMLPKSHYHPLFLVQKSMLKVILMWMKKSTIHYTKLDCQLQILNERSLP